MKIHIAWLLLFAPLVLLFIPGFAFPEISIVFRDSLIRSISHMTPAHVVIVAIIIGFLSSFFTPLIMTFIEHHAFRKERTAERNKELFRELLRWKALYGEATFGKDKLTKENMELTRVLEERKVLDRAWRTDIAQTKKELEK